jgi:DNA-directed RNA polymerase subunit RPC12/RpoP
VGSKVCAICGAEVDTNLIRCPECGKGVFEIEKSSSHRGEDYPSLPLHSRQYVRPYPEWAKVKNDLSLLHPMILKQLRTTMCFIVLDDGKPHAATILRLPSSEFPNTIQTTPMRLYVGLCRATSADLFFFYPVAADEKNLWWTETWIYPYDDEPIGPAPDDPLAKEARKRLTLLLNQEFSYVLIVDEYDRLRCARRIPFTKSQRQGFPALAGALKEYEGKRISLAQAKDSMDEYLAEISKPQLLQQFELLLKEE